MNRLGALVPLASGAVAVTAAFLVKRHASMCSPEQLDWILRPVVAIVTAATGIPFFHEAGVGWVNAQMRYSIVPACAGVNFLVVSFLAIAFALLRAERRPAFAAVGLVAAAIAAYGATVLANSARIAVALAAHLREAHPAGLDAATVHRTIGVLIYVPVLFIVYDLADRLGRRRA